MASNSKMIIMAMLSVVLMSMTSTQAQDLAGQSCVQALIPCQPYLASPKPPAACCDPLKEAVKTQLPCLCAHLTNPQLGATFNMTQAMQLPLNCGIEGAGPSLCAKVAAGPNASAPSDSTPSKKPATPPPSGNGAAGKSIAFGGPVLGMMMLVLAGLMFY